MLLQCCPLAAPSGETIITPYVSPIQSHLNHFEFTRRLLGSVGAIWNLWSAFILMVRMKQPRKKNNSFFLRSKYKVIVSLKYGPNS